MIDILECCKTVPGGTYLTSSDYILKFLINIFSYIPFSLIPPQKKLYASILMVLKIRNIKHYLLMPNMYILIFLTIVVMGVLKQFLLCVSRGEQIYNYTLLSCCTTSTL